MVWDGTSGPIAMFPTEKGYAKTGPIGVTVLRRPITQGLGLTAWTCLGGNPTDANLLPDNEEPNRAER